MDPMPVVAATIEPPFRSPFEWFLTETATRRWSPFGEPVLMPANAIFCPATGANYQGWRITPAEINTRVHDSSIRTLILKRTGELGDVIAVLGAARVLLRAFPNLDRIYIACDAKYSQFLGACRLGDRIVAVPNDYIAKPIPDSYTVMLDMLFELDHLARDNPLSIPLSRPEKVLMVFNIFRDPVGLYR